MDIIHSIIWGIIEGLTEFLPISSTAHLVLAADVLRVSQTDFAKSFEIIIQLGAILAVVWLYGKQVILDKEIIKRLIVSFIPTSIFGFLLYKIFKTILMENLNIIVWALILGGIIMIIFEYFHKEKPESAEEIEKITYKQSLILGICQSLAIVPGVSRAAATIISGMAIGIKRKTIVEYSFLLAVPTMLAASGYDIMKNGMSFSMNQIGVLLLGFLIAFMVAIFAIKFLLKYIKNNNFIWFGVYRIIIGIIFLLFI